MLPECKPRVEKIYFRKDWSSIWKNLIFKYINIKDREIVFKFIHEILAVNNRLYQMKIKQSSSCEFCQSIDTNIHKFYYCPKSKVAVSWLKKLLEYVSNMRFQNVDKLLYLEFPKLHKKIRNAMWVIS